jgi:uncharacterized protein YbjT (DUF2867 family)
VQNSGIDYTIVRPNFIFQNFINYDLDAVRKGMIYLPSGDGKTSYIDTRDVASFIVEILKNSTKHIAATYTITGSEALSHWDMAAIFSKVLGKEVKNQNPSEEEYKNLLLSYKLPQDTVDFMAMLYSFIKAGYFTAVTDDFQKIVGRTPISFESFVKDNRSAFMNSCNWVYRFYHF